MNTVHPHSIPFCYLYSSPAGKLYLAEEDGFLVFCDWMSLAGADVIEYSGTAASQIIIDAVDQLQEYFTGIRKAFNVPMRQRGSEFACKVWKVLEGIPYGTTVSYREVARKIGAPGAVRAVATAIARNRLNIFIGCHRVLPSSLLPYSPGKPVGNYRGGSPAKQHLCQLEFNHRNLI